MGDNKISEAAVNEPLQVFSKGTWLCDVTEQQFTAEELNEAAFAAYSPHLQGEAVPVGHVRRDSSVARMIVNLPEGTPLFAKPQPAELSEQHPDDLAVDTFANAMKSKMTISRWRGRSGWDDRSQCSQSQLSAMLRAHVEKGDPVDVANFCMMLSLRGEGIEPAAELAEVSGDSGELDGWAIAEKVRTDLDRQSCPDAYMRIAVESVVKHIAATGKQQVGEVQADAQSHIEALEAATHWSSTSRRFKAALLAGIEALASRQPVGHVPDGVWEALQRIIENSALHGPASNEDAVLVARYRRDLLAAPFAQGIDMGQQKDSARYQKLRRKICIAGGAFHIINLRPTYIAPDAAAELDAVLDSTKIDGRDAGTGVGDER